MFPSKGMVDFMGETSRLTSIRMDGDPSLNTFNSPFQTSVANRSSSSTDTSPDSFFSTPFLSPHLTELQNQNRPVSRRLYESNRPAYESSTCYDTSANIFDSGIANYDNLYNSDRNLQSLDTQIFDQRQLTDTPFQRRQRPIVGRKIYGSQSGLSINDANEIRSDSSENISQTNKIHHYELFPSSEKSFEFPTPIKKTLDFTKYAVSNTLSSTSSLSIPSQFSPRTLCQSLSPISNQSTASYAWQNRIRSSIPEFTVPFNPASCEGTSRDEIKQSKMCMFCRKNGETSTVYMTHCVKEKIGNTYRVTCPILRSHVCTQCGASGDEAHTITYCPILKTINNGKPLKSTTVTLKNTRIKSNGRRRY